MAEFCLECWNKINETNDPPEKYVLSWELDFCEECGEMKHVVVMERRYALPLFLRLLFLPAHLIVIGVQAMFDWIRRRRKPK